mgnify:CR=1 FL=1
MVSDKWRASDCGRHGWRSLLHGLTAATKLRANMMMAEARMQAALLCGGVGGGGDRVIE